MLAITPTTPLERGGEMFERRTSSIFDVRSSKQQRPESHYSEATEILDTDFEDDSEYEASPKVSFDSDDRRRSQTTISSYDEARTPSPRDSHAPQFDLRLRPVVGPKGPHLFRASQSSSEFDFDFHMDMSPVELKEPQRPETAWTETTVTALLAPPTAYAMPDALPSPGATLRIAEAQIRSWSTHQVVDWMFESGIEPSVIECFEIHDINGSVLLDLQFDHLRELDIQSFGKRHQLWSAICLLRGDDHPSPEHTPFQDISRPMTTVPDRGREQWADSAPARPRSATPGGGKKRRGRKAPKNNDIITPAESISIVAIEQLVPKPHHCSKGEDCSKWRKQQRHLERMRRDNAVGIFPISPAKGGHIIVTGDPGNPSTAENLVLRRYEQPDLIDVAEDRPEQQVEVEEFQPTSEAIPSLVASSDLLGPGPLPEFALHEAALSRMGDRNAREHVEQFLQLQHMNSPLPPDMAEPCAATPEFEMFPSNTTMPFPAQYLAERQSARPPVPPQHTPDAHAQLKSLPRLEIPRASSAGPQSACSVLSPDTATPCRTARSPFIYRLATPASEMDVPVTAVPIGPISRDASQSVPPNMHYREPSPLTRTQSRGGAPDWRRPSMQLPAVHEGRVLSPNSAVSGKSRPLPTTTNSDSSVPSHRPSVQDPSRDAPNMQYFSYGENCSHAGWMRKRKTKLLRHEWQDAHFRLKGTQLAMHANARLGSAAVDTIDVDRYAVACSSVPSSSKLSAAMKAFSIKSQDAKAKADATAFAFQLVPSRENPNGAGTVSSGKLEKLDKAHSKTHHFAVKSKDERIDWMRELMLAKALQQKGRGYEVEVNGVPLA